MEAKNKIAYLDLASVICAISVVILHSNACFWHFSTSPYWARANMIECLFYFSVPIFFMISGVTLIDYNKRYSMKEYFLKRTNKVLIPYIFWSLFAILYNTFFIGAYPPSDVNLSFVLTKLFSGMGMEIYWFFIPLLSIYLVIPIFAFIEDKHKKNIFLYFTVACLLFNALIPLILEIIKPDVVHSFYSGIGVKYLIFITIGYLIHNYDIKPQFKSALYILASVSLLVHIIGTYILSMGAHKIVETYKGFTNLPSIFYAAGIFLFFKEYGDRIMQNGFVFKTVNFLRSYTFGIYLLHIYTIRTILKLCPVDACSVEFVLVVPFISIFFSIAFIYLIRKIPFLKRTLP